MTTMRQLFVVVVSVAAAALLLVGSASAKSNVTVFCGMTVTSNLKLTHNLDCSGVSGHALMIGADNVSINLAGHTITGDENSNDAGIFDDGWTHVTVSNGKIVNYGYGVELNLADGSVVQNLTLTGNETSLIDFGATGLRFQNNTIADSLGGVILIETNSDLVTKNKVTDAEIAFGIFSMDSTPGSSVSNTFSKNSVDDAEFGFDSEGNIDSTTYSGNSVHDAEFGIAEGVQGSPSGNGALASGNKIDDVDAGIYIDHEGSGSVTLEKNVVTNAYEVGIETIGAFLDVCECPTDQGSTVTNNSVKNTHIGEGFFDEFSLNSTFSGNTSSNGAETGFVFEAPAGMTITGNTANSNAETGIFLEDNDPGVGLNALAFTNNTAKQNQDFGMYADFPQSGSGNFARKNMPFDCFNIACAGSHVPTSAPAHAPVSRPVIGTHAGLHGAPFKVPTFKH